MDARTALARIVGKIDEWQDRKGVTLNFVDADLVDAARQILGEVEEPIRSTGDELADLEQAVCALLEHDGRTVDAWVVVAGMRRLDPDVVRVDVSPLNHSLDYAVSSGTPPEHALGLADALTGKLRRIARQGFVGEE